MVPVSPTEALGVEVDHICFGHRNRGDWLLIEEIRSCRYEMKVTCHREMIGTIGPVL